MSQPQYLSSSSRDNQTTGRATDESPHFRQGRQTCFSPKRQHLWGPSSALFELYRGLCSQGKSSRGVKITIHIGLVQGLRMSGAVPLLPSGLHRTALPLPFFLVHFYQTSLCHVSERGDFERKLRDLAMQYIKARVGVCLLPCSFVLSCHGCLHFMRCLLFYFVVRTFPLNKIGTRFNTCWIQNICTAAEL